MFHIFRGLKEHIVIILARLLEADPSQGMKFDELFQAVESIKAMKVNLNGTVRFDVSNIGPSSKRPSSYCLLILVYSTFIPI
jgi:hypothetical protein